MADRSTGVKGEHGLLARLRALAVDAGMVVGGIDPVALTGAEAERVLAEVTRVRNIVAAAVPGLAARVEETGRWRQAEARSAGSHLGGLVGGTAGAGRRLAETGRRLEAAPEAKRALGEGRLSGEQAEVVAGAVAETASSPKPEVAERASEVEARLLEVAAGGGDLARLRDEAARAAQAARDEAQTRRVQHQTRHLRQRSYDDGSVGGSWKLPAGIGAEAWALLERLTQHRFETQRAAGVREPREAYAADAFCHALGIAPPVDPDQPTPADQPEPDAAPPAETESAAEPDTAPPAETESKIEPGTAPPAEASAGGPVPAPRVNLHKELVVVVDADSLRSGEVGPDGTCEIPGVGPVPVQTARDLLGEAGVSIIVKDGVDIADVTIGGRRLSKAMRLAMLAGNGWACADCGTPYALQGDHDTPYALSQHTRLDELRPRCPVCHARKTKREAAQTAAAGRARAAQARQVERQRRRAGAALIATLALVLVTRGP